MSYLKLGFEKLQNGGRDKASNTTSVDTQNRDQVPVSRGLNLK